MGESFFFFLGEWRPWLKFYFSKDETKTAEANRLLMAVERENMKKTRNFTSSDMRWTSVTSHQAHAHPPTIVVLELAPQQPPAIRIQLFI